MDELIRHFEQQTPGLTDLDAAFDRLLSSPRLVNAPEGLKAELRSLGYRLPSLHNAELESAP